MKKSLILLAAFAFILPVSAFAEVLHQGTASIGYAVRDQEMIVRGSAIDGDYTGTQLAASFFTSDQLEIGGGYMRGNTKVLGEKFKDTDLYASATYHFSRANLRTGIGAGLAAGLKATHSKLSVAGTSDSINSTDIHLGYQLGLGSGYTFNADLYTDIKEFGTDRSINIGLIKAYENTYIKASYGITNEEEHVSKSDGKGYVISVGLLF